jgi:hypothetical protein
LKVVEDSLGCNEELIPIYLSIQLDEVQHSQYLVTFDFAAGAQGCTPDVSGGVWGPSGVFVEERPLVIELCTTSVGLQTFRQLLKVQYQWLWEKLSWEEFGHLAWYPRAMPL